MIACAGSVSERERRSQWRSLCRGQAPPALLTAVELIRKGSTACYDLFVEVPAPSAKVSKPWRAPSRSGDGAVVAPMVADRSLYLALLD